MFKRIVSLLLALMLLMSCAAQALTIPTLSLADKIQKSKNRSYLEDDKSLTDSWSEAMDTADRIKSKSETGSSSKSGSNSGKSSNAGKSSGSGKSGDSGSFREDASSEKSMVLPSVMERDHEFTISEYKDYGHYTKLSYKSDDPEKLEFAKSYVQQLVQTYNYTLSYQGIGETEYHDYRHSEWYLQHPDSSVGRNDPISEEHGNCDVYISLNQYYDFDDCTFTVYCVADLIHADADRSNASSNDDDYCWNCGNSGKCRVCGGDGNLGDLVNKIRCTAMGCLFGNCTYCDN